MADPITGERLTPFTSVLTFAGLMSGVGSGGVARKLGTEALERLAKELGVTTDGEKASEPSLLQPSNSTSGG